MWNTPYLFNAKEFDEETGMYYYGARYYNPQLSVWISVDPLYEVDLSSSPYVFCGNNPIVRIDSDGKIWDTVWDVGNLVYDVGAAIYHHVTGDHNTAKENWTDAGFDALAAVVPFVPAGASKVVKTGAKTVKTIDKANDAKKTTRNVTKVFPTRKKALDARPKPLPAKQGQKKVTRQTRNKSGGNKSGEGNKFKTDGGKQTPHVHDRNHGKKGKTNIHYRVGKKK